MTQIKTILFDIGSDCTEAQRGGGENVHPSTPKLEALRYNQKRLGHTELSQWGK